MTKVALLTTWGEICGLAEYAKNLVGNCLDTEFTVIARPNWPKLWELAIDCQIVLVNYEPGLLSWLSPVLVRNLSIANKKTVMILHTSHEGINREPFSITRAFDRVVVHEKTQEGFVYIPCGIVECWTDPDKKTKNSLGSCGFPFPWKGFHQVAQAAQLLGKSCTIISADSSHADTMAMRRCVMDACPTAEYVTDWLPEADVISKLAENEVNVFAYGGGLYGISGAVRLGLASGRPCVLSRNRQFRDLYDYEDEIEFTPTTEPADIADAVKRVLDNKKRPKRVLEDMGWSKTGKMYSELFQSLV